MNITEESCTSDIIAEIIDNHKRINTFLIEDEIKGYSALSLLNSNLEKNLRKERIMDIHFPKVEVLTPNNFSEQLFKMINNYEENIKKALKKKLI